jgi:hypothetical protein
MNLGGKYNKRTRKGENAREKRRTRNDPGIWKVKGPNKFKRGK